MQATATATAASVPSVGHDSALSMGLSDYDLPLSPAQVLCDGEMQQLATQVAELALVDDGPISSSSSSAAKSLEESATFQSHSRGVWRLMPLDDRHVVSASYDGTAKIWNTAHSDKQSTSKPLTLRPTTKKESRQEILSLARLPDGALVTGSAKGYMNFWKLPTGASLGFLKEKRQNATGFYSLASLSSNQILSGACQRPPKATAQWEHVIKLWDRSSSKVSTVFTGHQGGISGLVLLDQTHFASSSADKTVRVWDLTTQQTTARCDRHTDYVYSLCSLNAATVASASRDCTVRLFDTRTANQVQLLQMSADSLQSHSSTVYDVAPIADTGLVTGSRDGYVKVWDTRKDSSPVKTLDASGEIVYSVATLGSQTIVGGTCGKGPQGQEGGNVIVWKTV